MDLRTEHLLVQHAEDVTVVTINDRRILEKSCIRDLEEALLAVVKAWKRPNIVLDFSNVGSMSSAFLGLLVKVQTLIFEKGGQLTLTNIAPDIRKVFEITQLTRVFDLS